MYLSHFGLDEPPFRITPHTDFFFDGANRGATLEALLYAITHDEGIVKVSGEVGSGKTMLCRVLMERLPKNVDIIYLSNPSLARDEILFAIADELKLNVAGARTAVLLRTLQEHLIKVYAEGRQVVVLIDEAHAMPLETLEEIRLLSNLESSRHKLLQIVLFGQPELEENLNIPQMRQLKERITHSFRLEPLVRDDIAQYMIFRMRAAGYRGPDIFSPAAVRALARASEGLTRRINILADKSLLAAFSENTHQVTAKHVRAAIRDSEFHRAGRASPLGWTIAAAVAAGIVIGGLGLRFLGAAAPAPGVPQSANASAAAAAPPPTAAVVNSAPVAQQTPGTAPPAATPVQPERPPAEAMPRLTVARAAQSAADLPAPGIGPLTRQRLAATESWLKDAPGSAYAIQVMALTPGSERELEAFLARADKLTGLNDIYLYQTRIKGVAKPGFAVVYGSYASPEKGRQAMAALPDELRSHLPYLRTVDGIRREIAEPDVKTTPAS
jgi:MSHA biogenesis protein MshM